MNAKPNRHGSVAADGMNSQYEHGFTLIEILVSITLMAVILALLGTSVQIIGRSLDATAGNVSRQDTISRGIDALKRDVENIQRIVRMVDGKPEFIFQGQENAVKMVVIEPPYPTEPGPFVVRYTAAAKGGDAALLRSRAAYRQPVGNLDELEFGDTVSVLPGHHRYRFTYGQLESGRLRWFSSWPYANRLPNIIQLNIEAVSNDALAFPPVSMIVAIDAELDCAGANPQFCTAKTDGRLDHKKPPAPKPDQPDTRKKKS